MKNNNRILQKSIGNGVIIGIIALFLAVLLSGGGRHGSFIPAKILFPFTMMSTANDEPINLAFILIALIQFPIYGFLYGLGTIKNMSKLSILTILSIHILGVIIALKISGKQFA